MFQLNRTFDIKAKNVTVLIKNYKKKLITARQLVFKTFN